MAGLVLATWSTKSIKLTIKIAISHSGFTPLLRSFLRLQRLLRSRWGDAPATASVVLFVEQILVHSPSQFVLLLRAYNYRRRRCRAG